MPFSAPSTITLRRATTADALSLAQFGATAFVDTFAADNRPSDMAMYLAEAFGETVQRGELANPAITVFVAERDGELAGYAMLREGGAPTCVGGHDAVEIARLYAARRWIGAGIGAALMERCLAEAGANGRSTIWLGVWEHNVRAITFYRRWGFSDVGSQEFQLGADRQTDRVMARRVAGEL